MTNFLHFMRMGGYGYFIFSAYGLVCLTLFIQWIKSWRRWQRFKKQIVLMKQL